MSNDDDNNDDDSDGDNDIDGLHDDDDDEYVESSRQKQSVKSPKVIHGQGKGQEHGQGQGQGQKRIHESLSSSKQTKPAAKKVKYEGKPASTEKKEKKPAAASQGGSSSSSKTTRRKSSTGSSSSSSSRSGKKEVAVEIDFVKYYTALQVHHPLDTFFCSQYLVPNSLSSFPFLILFCCTGVWFFSSHQR